MHCDLPPVQPHCVPLSLLPSSCDLQLQLEKVTTESQERMDAQAASIAKLNKALQGKLQVRPPPTPELGQGRAELGWAGIWDSRIWVTSNVRVPLGCVGGGGIA